MKKTQVFAIAMAAFVTLISAGNSSAWETGTYYKPEMEKKWMHKEMDRPWHHHKRCKGGNTGTSTQEGYENTAQIGMTGCKNNTDVFQYGEHNDALVDVKGKRNNSWVYQEGYGNTAEVYQSKRRNDANLEQYGYNNHAFMDQYGKKNKADVFQEGEENSVFLSQGGKKDSATVSQYGFGNYTEIIQE